MTLSVSSAVAVLETFRGTLRDRCRETDRELVMELEKVCVGLVVTEADVEKLVDSENESEKSKLNVGLFEEESEGVTSLVTVCVTVTEPVISEL